MAEGRTHGRVAHSGGRRNASDSAGGATDGRRSVALTLHSAGDFRRLSAAWGAHIEVEGSGEVGSGSASWDVALVGVHGSFGGSVSSGRFGFLFALHIGVFDIDAVFVDVSLLVVGPELSVLVTALHEDSFISGVDGDIVVEFLDVFIGEFVEEVDDQSAGDFVDLDPGRMHDIFFGLGHSLGLISVDFVEFFGLDNVETEEFVFSDRFFTESHCLDGLGGKFIEEFLHIFFSDFRSDSRNNHSSGIFDVSETAIEDGFSELRSEGLEMFVGLDGFFVGGEGQVGPASSGFVDGGVGVDDVPLGALSLHELFDLIGQSCGVFFVVGFDTFEVEHVGLIFLGVFVDFTFGVSSEDVIGVDFMGDAVENDFVLVFAVGVVEDVLTVFDGYFSDSFGLFDVGDVEEDTGVSEGFFVGFGVRDGDFVDFNGIVEKRFDYSLNLFFKIFIIEVFGFIFLYFFLCETMSFQLEHHLR